MTATRILFAVTAMCWLAGSLHAEDQVLLDFHTKTAPPSEWEVEGYAFGSHRPIPGERQRAVLGTRNQRYVQTGRMSSPPFAIETDYLKITCAGTFHPTHIAVVLVIDGKDVRSCSPERGYGFLGYQLHQQQIKFFQPPEPADYYLDVRHFRGSKATIELRDR